MSDLVLWVDDTFGDERSMKIVSLARREGFHIIGERDPVRALELVCKDPFLVVLIDLRMPEVSGPEFARKILAERPVQPIIFWSDFAADPEFVDLRHAISPVAKFRKLPKLREMEPAALRANLLAPLRELLGEARFSEDATLSGVPEEQLKPLAISPSVYEGLDVREKLATRRAAADACRPLLDAMFNRTAASWAIVCGTNGEVVEWGEAMETIPSEDEMRSLAHSRGCVPFLFTRPVEVESFEVSTGSPKWTECPSDGDFYPSVALDFLECKSHAGPIEFHFDCGSERTFISHELMMDLGVMPEPPHYRIGEGVRIPNQPYSFVPAALGAVATDGVNSIDVNVTAQLVLDWWSDGPFKRLCPLGKCAGSVLQGDDRYRCSKRYGLIGRNLLVDNELSLVLDGANRKTRFLAEDGAVDHDDAPRGARKRRRFHRG